MNPKLLLLIGFLALAMAFLGIGILLPQGIIFAVPKIILLILAVVCVIAAFASRYYTYLIIALIRQRKRNIILSDQSPYWISSTGESILRKAGDDFIATVYINIPLYVSASEMTDEEKLRFTGQVSRLVGRASAL
jgi:hypothetical protein